MTIDELIKDKTLKSKEKTETLGQWLLESKISPDELITFAHSAKDSPKATCIEALELATQQKPKLINEACFQFISAALTEKAPRIKWESAKVIGNTAHLFPEKLDISVGNLLINTEDSGTVVRWAAAFALGEILKLKTKLNKELIPAVESIILREEKNSIIKIYQKALKEIAVKK